MAAKQKKPPVAEHKVRIIGGQWRGRKLNVRDAEGLRPTGDRVRETLFNWLSMDIADAYCLDAFAGTGALGLEALSRGARFTQFIEQDAASAANIRDNVATLKTDHAAVTCGDFLSWRPAKNCVFDLVFFDPPFQQDLWNKAIAHLSAHCELSEHALIYIESPRDQTCAIPAHWQTYKNKTFGQVNIALYKVQKTNPPHTG